MAWTDNFNRAGPGLGANWTGSVGSDLSIDSSIRVVGAAGVDASMYWNANIPTDAQYAQAKYVGAVGDFRGPTVRGSATDFVLLDGQYGNTRWKIEWYNGGAWTQIGTDYAVAPADGDIARIEAPDSTFEGFVNGTSRISGSNGSAPATGYTGLYTYDNIGYLDDFEGGDLTPPVGANPVNAVWDNFWHRGQTWYHFWQDAEEEEAGVTGTGAVTFGAMTAAGTADVPVTAAGAATFAAMTVAGTAVIPVTASGAATFAVMTASGTAGVAVAGVGEATFDVMVAAGTGEVEASSVAGSGAFTFEDMTAAGEAVIPVTSAGAASFAAMTASGTAGVVVVGAGAATLAEMAVAGTAGVAVAGAGAATFDAMSAAGTGTVAVSAAGAATLGEMTAAGTGAVGAFAEGTGAFTFEEMTLIGTASITEPVQAEEPGGYVFPIRVRKEEDEFEEYAELYLLELL